MDRKPFATFAIVVSIAACGSLAFISGAEDPSPLEPTRTDRYGDALPKGALMRLGTTRFCQPGAACVAYSPDGKILASGGSDNRVHFWDPETGRELKALEGHEAL